MSFVDECRREWKRLGLPEAVANEMASELAADLAEAKADGASPEDVLGYAVFDARAFAASWAEERGVIPRQPAQRRRSLLVAFVIALAVFAAIAAAGVALLAAPGHFASARLTIASSAAPPRIAPRLRVLPIHPFTWSARKSGGPPRIFVTPAFRPIQLATLPSPPVTAGLVFLGVGLGGIAATLATWLALDRRRRIVV